MTGLLLGGPELLAATFAIVLALPALGLRRFGPARVRAAVLLGLAALWLALAEPGWLRRDARPRQVTVLPTGAGQQGWAELQARVPGAELLPPAAPGQLAASAVRAALGPLGGDSRGETLLLWTGPIAPDEPDAQLGTRVRALSAVAPPPFEPGRIQLRAQRRFAAGRPGAFELDLGGPLADVRGTLALFAPDRTMTRLEVRPDARGFALLPWQPADGGTHELQLDLQAGTHRLHGTAQVEVAAPPRIAIAGGGPAAAALQVQGMQVAPVESVEQGLDADVLVLLAPPADADVERLVEFVDRGGGLLLIGGEQGGAIPLAASPLASLAPISRAELAAPSDGPGGREQPPRDEPKPPPPPAEPEPDRPVTGATEGAKRVEGPPALVERRTIALVLIVDKSGSMSDPVEGREAKIEYAKQSAYETAAMLGEGDEVALVTFGESAHVQLPLMPATDRQEIRRRIEGLVAREQSTLIFEALRVARSLLESHPAGVKHAVIVSDGEIHDARDPVTQAAARQLRAAGVTVSLIRIAYAGDTSLLAHSAALASPGRFINTFDPSAIPRLISAEVRRSLTAAGRAPEAERAADTPPALPKPEPKPPEPKPPEPKPPEPPPPSEPAPAAATLEVRAVSPSLLLEPMPQPPQTWPPLHGMPETAATPDAHVLLAAGERGLPLLAFCNRGAGRVAAWSADLGGTQSQAWLVDPAFPARLAQWVTALLPPLAARAPANLLAQVALEPAAPTAPERAWLARATGAEPAPVATYTPPPASGAVARQSLGRELTLPALLALLLLAFVEWRVRRTGG